MRVCPAVGLKQSVPSEVPAGGADAVGEGPAVDRRGDGGGRRFGREFDKTVVGLRMFAVSQ